MKMYYITNQHIDLLYIYIRYTLYIVYFPTVISEKVSNLTVQIEQNFCKNLLRNKDYKVI